MIVPGLSTLTVVMMMQTMPHPEHDFSERETEVDLEASRLIAAGTPPSPETRAFIARVKTVARVFLYKI